MAGMWKTGLTAFVTLLGGVLIGYLVWGQAGAAGPLSDQSGDRKGARTVALPKIAPNDFAILPCDVVTAEATCLIIAAGGKRVLVGAPAGIGGSGLLGDGGIPDAILLFGLEAGRIEGLDEIRTRIWERGIRQSVRLIGGQGIEEISAGLDQTYIVPDAVAYIRGRHKGGFATLPFQPFALRHGDLAFNTGDLMITALAGGIGRVAYYVTYQEQRVILADCGSGLNDWTQWPEADAYIACFNGTEETPFVVEAQAAWPVREAVYLIKAE